MDPEYWLQRWREGRIGWHHERVMPLLEQHWPTIGVARGTRVLVPLCGKSLDMLWLAARGLHVLGVDPSPLAIKSFLEENHLEATSTPIDGGTQYRVGNVPAGGSIELLHADIFSVATATLGECHAFYDRAATIALPVPLRERFVREVYGKLPAGARGLLIVLDYPPAEMDGPPFPVDDAGVRRLFEAQWDTRQLERREIPPSQPGFRQGLSSMHTAVYELTRHAAR